MGEEAKLGYGNYPHHFQVQKTVVRTSTLEKSEYTVDF